MSRSALQPEHPPKVTDLLIRQKCEAMIEYGYVAATRKEQHTEPQSSHDTPQSRPTY